MKFFNTMMEPALKRLESESIKRGKALLFTSRGLFKEGGQDYDLMNWNADQVIADVIDQYEKHMHFLQGLR